MQSTTPVDASFASRPSGNETAPFIFWVTIVECWGLILFPWFRALLDAGSHAAGAYVSALPASVGRLVFCDLVGIAWLYGYSSLYRRLTARMLADRSDNGFLGRISYSVCLLTQLAVALLMIFLTSPVRSMWGSVH